MHRGQGRALWMRSNSSLLASAEQSILRLVAEADRCSLTHNALFGELNMGTKSGYLAFFSGSRSWHFMLSRIKEPVLPPASSTMHEVQNPQRICPCHVYDSAQPNARCMCAHRDSADQDRKPCRDLGDELKTKGPRRNNRRSDANDTQTEPILPIGSYLNRPSYAK